MLLKIVSLAAVGLACTTPVLGAPVLQTRALDSLDGGLESASYGLVRRASPPNDGWGVPPPNQSVDLRAYMKFLLAQERIQKTSRAALRPDGQLPTQPMDPRVFLLPKETIEQTVHAAPGAGPSQAAQRRPPTQPKSLGIGNSAESVLSTQGQRRIPKPKPNVHAASSAGPSQAQRRPPTQPESLGIGNSAQSVQGQRWIPKPKPNVHAASSAGPSQDAQRRDPTQGQRWIPKPKPKS